MKNRYRLDCKENINKEVTDFLRLEENEEFIELLFLEYSRDINWTLTNKLDLFNLKWLSDIEIEELLNDFLKNKTREIQCWNWISYNKVTVDDEEWIDYLNYIFKKALHFYEIELKWQLPRKYKNITDFFKTKDDVINFLKNTTKNIQSSQFNCVLTKISYAVNEIIDTPELLELDKKSYYLLKEKILPAVQLDEPNSNIDFWFLNWKISFSWKIIEFKMRMRWKNEESWTFKILKDENYLTANSIKDLIWIEFEVKNKEDALLLLSYFYQTFFHKTNGDGEIINTIKEFKDKWIISQSIVKRLERKWLISWEFLELIKKSSSKSKTMQNMQYSDIKFVWDIDLPLNLNDKRSQKKPHWVELRAILVWNTNEEWLSDHRILHVWKIVLTWVRLKWYITEAFIKHLINDLLENNPDLDEKFSNDEILEYFKAKLIKIERNWKIDIYTTKSMNSTIENQKQFAN